MKKILLTAVAAVLVSVLQATGLDPYFCNHQGTKLHYVRTSANNGSVVYRHTMSIDRISGSTIYYNSLFTKPNGNKMYGGAVRMTAKVTGSDVEMSVGETVASVMVNMLGVKDPKIEGKPTVLPGSMKPGDSLKDASGSATAGVAWMSINVTERKVLRKETLTTSAGRFDCIVVQEHKIEKGLRNSNTISRTWYARGIGMVRHDTFDKNMKPMTSEVLESMN